jgi:hypothetical protein
MLWPGLGYWPILFALLPWIARLTAGRFPFKRTAFDLPLALFLGTALVGVWAAYSREAAWFKFWVLVAALLVFYALAGQPAENLEPVAGLLSLIGVFLAIYFLVSYDWQPHQEDILLIERIAAVWVRIRPVLGLNALLPNVVGGILAMLFPFSIVPVVLGLRSRQYSKSGLFLAAAAVILFGLMMTSSRGAWLALVAAAGFWLVWRGSTFLFQQRRISRLHVFAVVPILLVLAIIFLLWVVPDRVLAALDLLPGAPSGESRLDLGRSTLHLIADYAWTGAGLDSFSGIFSQYILVIPFEFFKYSHNFYLDLAVEQGAIAVLIGLTIFLLAGWYFLKRLEEGQDKPGAFLLAAAGITSLIAVLLHGLMDDPLYGMSGTPFLFLLPGMAAAVSGDLETGVARSASAVARTAISLFEQPVVRVFSIGLLLLFLSTLFVGGRTLLASWYADLGAVEMSRVELADWPLGKWNANPDVSTFGPAVKLFERSLAANPGEATAHHRLGLIALQGRDFSAAQAHLEKAVQFNPEHPGIKKVLGFVYVWNDQPGKAAVLLSEIPEAVSELKQYTIFWKRHHRQDLAMKAEDMLDTLASVTGTLHHYDTGQQ